MLLTGYENRVIFLIEYGKQSKDMRLGGFTNDDGFDEEVCMTTEHGHTCRVPFKGGVQ